jgi:cell division protein FtsB
VPEGLGPWPPLLGGFGAFLWLVRLVINYQSTIGERYGKEIERLDSELQQARAENTKLRTRIEALEDAQGELRYLRRITQQHGIYNPWDPPGLEGVVSND